jgi:hypothetical protein
MKGGASVVVRAALSGPMPADPSPATGTAPLSLSTECGMQRGARCPDLEGLIYSSDKCGVVKADRPSARPFVSTR